MRRLLLILFIGALFISTNHVLALPLEINDCEELQLIGNDVGYPLTGDYTLGNDIDCSMTNPADLDWDNGGTWASGEGFFPIGIDGVGTAFTGTLDGQGFVITGLFIDDGSLDEVGLFGATFGAGISNIGLEDVDISSTYGAYIGTLTG